MKAIKVSSASARWKIYDDNGDHIATMVWSALHDRYLCDYHRADQWGTDIEVWRKLIKEEQGK